MNTTAEERQLLRTLAEEGLEDVDGEAMTETWNLIIDTVDDLEQAIEHVRRLVFHAGP